MTAATGAFIGVTSSLIPSEVERERERDLKYHNIKPRKKKSTRQRCCNVKNIVILHSNCVTQSFLSVALPERASFTSQNYTTREEDEELCNSLPTFCTPPSQRKLVVSSLSLSLPNCSPYFSYTHSHSLSIFLSQLHTSPNIIMHKPAFSWDTKNETEKREREKGNVCERERQEESKFV